MQLVHFPLGWVKCEMSIGAWSSFPFSLSPTEVVLYGEKEQFILDSADSCPNNPEYVCVWCAVVQL